MLFIAGCFLFFACEKDDNESKIPEKNPTESVVEQENENSIEKEPNENEDENSSDREGDTTIEETPNILLNANRGASCETIEARYNALSEADKKRLEKKNNVNVANEILTETNKYRASKGVTPLKINKAATILAIAHTEYQIDIEDIDHDNFSSRSCAIEKIGGESTRGSGENVALGYRSAKSVVEGWISSSGHERNLRRETFNEIGIAAMQDSDGTWYYTQIFISKN